MSIRLRITIPDGELEEHLKNRSSKGIAIEMIRLATNYLNMSRNIERPIFDAGSNMDMKSVQEFQMLSDIESNKDEDENIEPFKQHFPAAMVDFGNDILEME